MQSVGSQKAQRIVVSVHAASSGYGSETVSGILRQARRLLHKARELPLSCPRQKQVTIRLSAQER